MLDHQMPECEHGQLASHAQLQTLRLLSLLLGIANMLIRYAQV